MVAQNISHLLFPMSIGIAGLIHASVQLMSQKKATWTGVATTGIAEFSSLDLSHVHMSHICPWHASSGVVSDWPAHIFRIITGKQGRKEKCSNILSYLYKCQFLIVPLAKESHMVQLSVTVDGGLQVTGKRYSLGLLMQLVYHSPKMCLWHLLNCTLQWSASQKQVYHGKKFLCCCSTFGKWPVFHCGWLRASWDARTQDRGWDHWTRLFHLHSRPGSSDWMELSCWVIWSWSWALSQLCICR